MPNLSDLEHEVHLWFLRTTALPDAELAIRAATVLSPQEQERAERFAFEKDRRSYRAAHWLLRWVLSEYLPVAPADWKFVRSLFGKPTLAAPTEGSSIRFNLSHTAGMVACAVTRAGDVGVDVETVRPRDYRNLARRFFAPEEAAQLEHLPDAEQTQAFFRLWTLKEAYVKAKGNGLSLDLSRFAFPDVMGDTIRIVFDDNWDDRAEDWQFLRHEPDDHHKIAVAVHRPAGSAIHWRIFPHLPQGTMPPESLQ